MPINPEIALRLAIVGGVPFTRDVLQQINRGQGVDEAYQLLLDVIDWFNETESPTLHLMVLAMAGALINILAVQNIREQRSELVSAAQLFFDLVVVEVDGVRHFDEVLRTGLSSLEIVTFGTSFWEEVNE